jgi:hypothetical protein
MTHTALVNDALVWSLAVMTVLLLMFLYAVIVAPPQGRDPTEAPVPEPPAPSPGPPLRRPQAPAFPVGTGGEATGAGFVATQAAAPAPLPPPPEASSEPPLRRVRAVGIAGLAFAGVALAVIGGLLFRYTVQGAMACSHYTAAICMDGFVLLTATQVLGAVIALAGIALLVTAVTLALR